MPIFTNAPPQDDRAYSLPLARTPANGKLIGIITTHDLIGCATHWYGGRTIPCEGETCKACLEGVPWRWHSYIAAMLKGTRHHVLLEFTAQASEKLIEYRDAHKTLRGCGITAKRLRNRANGRVMLTCTQTDLESIHLPPEPNVTKALSLIWGLPQPEVNIADRVRQQPRLAITRSNGKLAKKEEITHD